MLVMSSSPEATSAATGHFVVLGESHNQAYRNLGASHGKGKKVKLRHKLAISRHTLQSTADRNAGAWRACTGGQSMAGIHQGIRKWKYPPQVSDSSSPWSVSRKSVLSTLHSVLMATQCLVWPSPCVAVGGGGKLVAEGGRGVWLGRRGSFCKLRCTGGETSDVVAPAAVDVAPPTIELEIVGPEVGAEVTTTSVGSGEKLLRNIVLENKLELYDLYGKVMNCGGGGSCGTCIVEILEGKELLNERTDAEYKYLKKRPESWRLSCQTIVGDKSNSGKVVVKRLPQRKK